MKQINEQGYKDGGAAFAKGKTLRSLIEKRIELHKSEHTNENWQTAEDYQQSFELGFADALLTKLRSR